MPESHPDGDLPTKSVAFSLPVGRGNLHANARVPAGRTTVTELLPVIRNIETAITGRVEEEAQAAGHPISCSAGCAACCRQMVPLSFFEAEALGGWLRSLPENVRAELERRFHRALTALREAGVIDKVLDPKFEQSDEFAAGVTIDYFKAHVACPFLENENCGIYSIRPLVCREYMVTSPPALCQNPAENDVWGLDLPVKLSHALFSFSRKLGQNRRGWIPLVFLFAWARRGATPGDSVSGTGEEVLKKFLDEVAEAVEADKNRGPAVGGAEKANPS